MQTPLLSCEEGYLFILSRPSSCVTYKEEVVDWTLDLTLAAYNTSLQSTVALSLIHNYSAIAISQRVSISHSLQVHYTRIQSSSSVAP
jgi:hypothetical protein